MVRAFLKGMGGMLIRAMALRVEWDMVEFWRRKKGKVICCDGGDGDCRSCLRKDRRRPDSRWDLVRIT